MSDGILCSALHPKRHFCCDSCLNSHIKISIEDLGKFRQDGRRIPCANHAEGCEEFYQIIILVEKKKRLNCTIV